MKNSRITSAKNLGIALSHLRKEKSLSQKDIADLLEMTQGMISRYENGISIPDTILLEKWLKILGIEGEENAVLVAQVAELLMIDTKASTNKSPMITIPEYNVSASAGWGDMVGFEEVIEYHELPMKFLPMFESINAGVVRINGDSMYPTINSGDHVVVHLESRFFEDGIYLIRIDDSIYCKRLHKKFGSIQIISDNPIYDVMNVSADDGDSFQILGKVLLTLKKH